MPDKPSIRECSSQRSTQPIHRQDSPTAYPLTVFHHLLYFTLRRTKSNADRNVVFFLLSLLFSQPQQSIVKNQLKINFSHRFGCNVARHQDGKWALTDPVPTAERVPQLQPRVFHPTARPNTLLLPDAR